MTLAEALALEKAILKVGDKEMFVVEDTDSDNEVVSEAETDSGAETDLYFFQDRLGWVRGIYKYIVGSYIVGVAILDIFQFNNI